MPLLTQCLLETYGLRGTLMLLSAINLHTVICGALLRPTGQHKSNTDVDDEIPLLTSSKATGENEQLLSSKSSTKNICLNCCSLQVNILSIFFSLRFVTLGVITSMILGYVQVGWLTYIVSFTVSQGLSAHQASVISAFGGLGMFVIKALLPELNKVMTYKELMVCSSFLTASFLVLTTFIKKYIGLCAVSLFFGIGTGILSPEIYIAIKDVVGDDHYVTGVAISHVFYGLASIGSGFCTGKK